MSLSQALLIAIAALLVFLVGLVAWLLILVLRGRTEAAEAQNSRTSGLDDLSDALMEGVNANARALSGQVAQTDAKLSSAMTGLINYVAGEEKRTAAQVERFSGTAREDLARMNETLSREFIHLQGMVDERFAKVLETNAGAAEGLGRRLDEALERVRAENAEKLEAMRATVEEKLERTLTDRLSLSFRRVDEKLSLVESGLGEMRRMAASVSRLQNVLANVKTRGTFGEVQLGAILEEVLAPGQFEAQVRLNPRSAERVDFAVRLPGRSARNDTPCWLPIDSKFPLEDWEALEEAEREGDAVAATSARKGLERALLKQAKSIHDKYVMPPVTTEFAVMFLPSEGLYAEALRIPGLVDRLQRELRITPAGPTVITALLNSLLMGFMTLAMEKRSGEVWRLLTEVKTEFSGFSKQFEVVERKFREAQNSLEQMSVKSRGMGNRMQAIEALAAEREASSSAMLATSSIAENESDYSPSVVASPTNMPAAGEYSSPRA